MISNIFVARIFALVLRVPHLSAEYNFFVRNGLSRARVFRTYALVRPVPFLGAQRSKLYKWYSARAAQLKNVLGVKNTLQRSGFARTLERCGA